MPPFLVIATAVLVVAAIVLLARRRSQDRSEWMGELATVRDEVLVARQSADTAAAHPSAPFADLAAGPVGSEPDPWVTGPARRTDRPEPATTSGPTEPTEPARTAPTPARTEPVHPHATSAPTEAELVDEPSYVGEAVGGRRIAEYGGGDAGVTRIEGRDHVVTMAAADMLSVDLRRGSVWHRPAREPSVSSTVTVHTAAGWSTGQSAAFMVTSEADGWCYVLCFAGQCTVAAAGQTEHLRAGQVARSHPDSPQLEVSTAPPGALDGDDLVLLHRELDARLAVSSAEK